MKDKQLWRNPKALKIQARVDATDGTDRKFTTRNNCGRLKLVFHILADTSFRLTPHIDARISGVYFPSFENENVSWRGGITV